MAAATGRRLRLVAAVAGGVAGAALLVTLPAHGYYAVETTNATAGAAADALPAGAVPRAAAVPPNGDTVTVDFPEAASSSGVALPSVVLRRYPAGGGAPVTVTASCTVDSGDEDCTDTDVPDGVWRYTDTPAWGASWTGAESGPSPVVTVDTLAPTVAVTYPTAAVSVAGWAGTVVGTAADGGSGVASVTVAVEDDTSGAWWDGTAFDSADPVWLAATGTATWTLAVPAGGLVPGHAYTVEAAAVDEVGNRTVADAGFAVSG